MVGFNSREKKMLKIIEISQKFIDSTESTIDYGFITDMMRELSGGKYVGFNIFNYRNKEFKTRGLSGESKYIKKANKLLGFDILGKSWPYDEKKYKAIKGSQVTIYKNLREIASEVLGEKLVKGIEDFFDIGQVALISIYKDKKIMGDFTIMMDIKDEIKDLGLLEIYASMVGMMLDKTEAKKLSAENKESLDRFFSVNIDLLCIADFEGNLVRVNRAWKNVLGFDPSYLEGKKFIEFVHPEDVEKTMKALKIQEEVLELDEFVNRYRRIDGSYRYLEWRTQAYENLIYASARDITEKREKQKEIEFLSFHDHLTGLYNRRYLDDSIFRLDNNRNIPFSIISIDVDNLKFTNDSYGHEAGDKLLVLTSEIISDICRSEDIVCRIGGDEFVILLPNATEAVAKDVIKRINDRVEKTKMYGKTVSMSMGHATKTNKNEKLSDILKLADDEMYVKKFKHYEQPAYRQ
ncbi:sensor domain-containing diguanylate cyclase [Alkalibacter mobilis]|uniref:sensor domain-containing diguanylate cyclase n=1 Tax=Alkalibacter mobilis TaxID=2787712 RepID=UPI00189F9921|nr:diguanylate cyclase [Alkalibacter mobilis]MBF7097361.1 diguanylate cyclase [Alkalibacter mobilis]